MPTEVTTLYQHLKKLDLLKHSPTYWWPNYGTFEVLIGAILTQNTTWKNVEKSLQNLQKHTTLESFLQLDEETLKNAIKPSGFYNQKAPRLLQLAKNIKENFGSFEEFTCKVSREWLLEQKGIGEESADAILCYACKRGVMVVDSYTKRTLCEFDIYFKTYKEYQTFLQDIEHKTTIKDKTLFYARFHGMFVEYQKLKKSMV